MSIADVPLWAQNPTAEVRREVAFSPDNGGRTLTPFSLYLAWSEFDPDDWKAFIGADVPDGMSIDEARRLWVALGELLAIRRFDPVPSQLTPTIAVTISDPTGPRNLIRTSPLPVGVDEQGHQLTVHVEVSGDPLPHGPDEQRPTVCINRVLDNNDPDQAFIEIDDPDSLDQLIEALIATGPVLRDQRKKAGL